MANVRIRLRQLDRARVAGAKITIRTSAPFQTIQDGIITPYSAVVAETNAQGEATVDLVPSEDLGRGAHYTADIPADDQRPAVRVTFGVPAEGGNLEDLITAPPPLAAKAFIPVDAQQAILPQLEEGEGWLGPERTPTPLATEAELEALAQRVAEGGEGGAHDATAREAAQLAKLEADRNATQLERLGNEVEDVSTLAGENRDKLVTPTKAQAEAAAGDTVYGWNVTRLRELIAAAVKAATTTIRGTVLIARNIDVDASETDLSRVPDVSKAIRLIRRILAADVRSIPEAEASHVGRPLVATSSRRPWGSWARLGTDGYDDNSVTEPKLSAEVRTKLNAATEAGTDQTARDAAAAAKAAADAAQGDADTAGTAAAANAARLNRNRVFGDIQLHPPGIPDRLEWPEFISVALTNKLDARKLAQIRCFIHGQPVGATVGDQLAPFQRLRLDGPAGGTARRRRGARRRGRRRGRDHQSHAAGGHAEEPPQYHHGGSMDPGRGSIQVRGDLAGQ